MAFYFFLLMISCAAAAHNHNAPSNLVRSSCLHARYPKVCVHTLSNYPGPARTPSDLARAAVSISYTKARKASAYLAQLRAQPNAGAAIVDCLDQLSDAAAELGDTVREIRALMKARDEPEFRWRVSNAETWVSAALTDQDTCLDGIGEVGSGVGSGEVRRRVKSLAKVTSKTMFIHDQITDTIPIIY